MSTVLAEVVWAEPFEVPVWEPSAVQLSFCLYLWESSEAEASVEVWAVVWDRTSDLWEEAPAVCGIWDQHRLPAPDAPCAARVS